MYLPKCHPIKMEYKYLFFDTLWFLWDKPRFKIDLGRQTLEEGDPLGFLEGLIAFFSAYGYVSVFGVLLICGFGLPIPEDITLVAGGVIAGLGYAKVEFMVLTGLAGVLVGDGIMFGLGRVFGNRILKNRLVLKLLTPERYVKVQNAFEKYGNWVLFFARFLPGLRSPIFLTDGSTRRVSFWQFLFQDGIAALISVPVWVYLGFHGAEQRDLLAQWIKKGQHYFLYGLIGAIIFALLYFWYKKSKKKPDTSTQPHR